MNGKILSKIDDDILSEIIAKCEGKMISGGPFKKKAALVVEAEPEEIEVESEEEAPEELEDGDLEELLEHYKKLKG